MKNMKTIYRVVCILCFICLLPVSRLSGQNAEVEEIVQKWYAMDAAIVTIERYDQYIQNLNDERYLSEFKFLFRDGNMRIYNDLLGLSSQKELQLDEYCKLVQSLNEHFNIRIEDVKILDTEKDANGVWKIKVKFGKALSYKTSCGIYLDSDEFFGAVHQLDAIMSYNSDADRCVIEALRGQIESERSLDDVFYVFQSSDSYRDSLLTYEEAPILTNQYKQAIIDGTINVEEFHYPDADIRVIPKVSNCNIVTIAYKPIRRRLRLSFGFGLGNEYLLDGTDDYQQYKSSGSRLALDYGYTFPSLKKVKTTLYTGLGLSQSSITLGFYGVKDYNFSTTADIDGDTYIRHYQGLSLNQKLKLSTFSVPLYLDINMPFGKVFNIYAQFGVLAHYCLGKGSVDTTTGNAYVYGIYNSYSNLRLDEHWGYNGFGNTTFSNANIDNDYIPNVSKLSVDALGGLGLRFNIPRSAFAFDMGATIQYGLENIVNENPNKIAVTSDSHSRTNAVVYNTVSGTTSTEHVRNLTEGLNSIKRKSIKFNIGLIYKF